jgi:hypothetical protein
VKGEGRQAWTSARTKEEKIEGRRNENKNKKKRCFPVSSPSLPLLLLLALLSFFLSKKPAEDKRTLFSSCLQRHIKPGEKSIFFRDKRFLLNHLSDWANLLFLDVCRTWETPIKVPFPALSERKNGRQVPLCVLVAVSRMSDPAILENGRCSQIAFSTNGFYSQTPNVEPDSYVGTST